MNETSEVIMRYVCEALRSNEARVRLLDKRTIRLLYMCKRNSLGLFALSIGAILLNKMIINNTKEIDALKKRLDKYETSKEI